MRVKKHTVWVGNYGRIVPVKDYHKPLNFDIGDIITVNGTEKRIVNKVEPITESDYDEIYKGYYSITDKKMFSAWRNYYITINVKNGHSDDIYECELIKYDKCN